MIAVSSGRVRPVIGPGGPEQSITSAVRSIVCQQLSVSGYRVSMVPVALSNSGRVRYAVDVEASLYISIECATDPRPGWTSVDGATIEAPRTSECVARDLFTAFNEFVPIRIRGIKYRDSNFLAKRLSCHVVTIKCGYLSNRADMVVMGSIEGQRRIAASIVSGVAPWVN